MVHENPEIVFQGGDFTVSGNPLALPVSGSMIVNVGAGATCSFGVPLLGDGGLQIEGGGTLVLQSTGNYAAGTIVSSGTLAVARADALPTGGALTIQNGGKVVLDSGLNTAVKISGLRLSLPLAPVPASNLTAAPASSVAVVIPADTAPLAAAVAIVATNSPPTTVGNSIGNGNTEMTVKTEASQPLAAKAKSVPAVKTRAATTSAVPLHSVQAVARDHVLTTRVGKWLPDRLSWLPFIEETSVRMAARTRHDILVHAVDEVLAKR